jgi:hypothetical protein
MGQIGEYHRFRTNISIFAPVTLLFPGLENHFPIILKWKLLAKVQYIFGYFDDVIARE